MNRRFSFLAAGAALLLAGAFACDGASAQIYSDSQSVPVLIAKSDSEFFNDISKKLNLSEDQKKRTRSIAENFDSRMRRAGKDSEKSYENLLNKDQRERFRKNKEIELSDDQVKAFERHKSSYYQHSDSEIKSFKEKLRPMLNDEQRRKLDGINSDDFRSRYSSSHSDYERRYRHNGRPLTKGGVVGNGADDSEYNEFDNKVLNSRKNSRHAKGSKFRNKYKKNRDLDRRSGKDHGKTRRMHKSRTIEKIKHNKNSEHKSESFDKHKGKEHGREHKKVSEKHKYDKIKTADHKSKHNKHDSDKHKK